MQVFELVNGDMVDKDEFCLIASLAERMTMLDKSVRTSFYNTDFAKLERNIRGYKKLYYVYGTSENSTGTSGSDGRMTVSDFKATLRSAGLDDVDMQAVFKALNMPGSSNNAIDEDHENEPVNFFNFLSYIPFFVRLHDLIVTNPLSGPDSQTPGECDEQNRMGEVQRRRSSLFQTLNVKDK
ncbi:hypothetical protein BJ742DRAFT_145208 [Cladochytrium replicatum]|nr:hypothetical protein BJ742DRAFT_145208 [Cladochytrium replicatum]